jgi:hypothetical protein
MRVCFREPTVTKKAQLMMRHPGRTGRLAHGAILFPLDAPLSPELLKTLRAEVIGRATDEPCPLCTPIRFGKARVAQSQLIGDTRRNLLKRQVARADHRHIDNRIIQPQSGRGGAKLCNGIDGSKGRAAGAESRRADW